MNSLILISLDRAWGFKPILCGNCWRSNPRRKSIAEPLFKLMLIGLNICLIC
ncbi:MULTISPECIES: hypothetical protein [unclassified Microcoleus]|uniref:hypothetical protein n=1 Tax=unclassified Microcoleus TaxID=2642155 RepID=UPI001D6C4CAE|nr:MULTISPECIES: hypothetical protein [unclassified Microcoleus]MCC3441737.1 hypothetical protein [Microcoleus sp. PH2017_03_ELD_O_A]MCC3468402.1 hypothetical protein [Microcoleus sp. PH2017_06_SFM_O_A]MCC3504229.1 hypothetical protein [Microcoleus sp. PH2017_19_SFW_U_A]MCC3523340.1 hypothetical protein [Microcoleus sp. PH2017_20_SFW_D_A]MCC3548833.1 hypothetical protein [Microcoleus sp. PH2017_24_DOB_U_A]MCC3554002.1 hypothetical protein [Microcoleus sp. PH2017_35_SFW_U_B]MCC3565106.1 hypot